MLGLVLSRRDVSVGFEEASVVEPVDPFERGVLEVVEATTGAAVSDELGLVEAVHRLGEGIGDRRRLRLMLLLRSDLFV